MCPSKVSIGRGRGPVPALKEIETPTVYAGRRLRQSRVRAAGGPVAESRGGPPGPPGSPILCLMSGSHRRLSMLRSYTPADALTIGNASCGTIAIFLCLDYVATGSPRYMWVAFVLIPLALVCDVLDGYVARTQK